MIFTAICIVVSVFTLMAPYVSARFIDYLVMGSDPRLLIRFCIVFAVLRISSVLFGYIKDRMYTVIHVTTSYELNRDIIKHIQSTSIKYLSGKNIGYLNQRIRNDSVAVTAFCISTIENILVNAILLFLSISMLLVFNVSIAIVLSLIIIAFFIVFKLFKEKIYLASFEYKEKQSLLYSKLYEQLFITKFLKCQGITDLFTKKVDISFRNLLNSGLVYQKLNYLFTGLDNIAMALAQIVLFIYGGKMVIQGELSIGQFSIIITYFNLMVKSIRYFFSFSKLIQDNLVAYNRLIEIINQPVEIQGRLMLSEINKINLKNIHFSYGNKFILKDFSASFEKGKIYTITGANGTGKSTLIDILLGLYLNDYKGEVLYNDINVKNVDLSYIRRNLIGTVEQDPVLINDSIQNNLFLPEDTELKERISLITWASDCKSWPTKLVQGLDSLIIKRVENLSGGEKLKISLLRVFLKSPEVMILDEPTSALDSDSRSYLLEHLHSLKDGRIIIIVTHDENILSIADERIVLQ